jgi:type II secretory pathway component GspD/PulD (secretin)
VLHWFLLLLLNQCSELVKDQRLKPLTNACDLKKLSAPPPHFCSAPEDSLPPKRPKIAFAAALYKPVSIEIAEDTDIRCIFRSLGDSIGVKVNFLIPETKGLNYSARQKPFIHLLDDICDALNLRFSAAGTNVKIEQDKPFFKNYAVHFLKFAREAENKVSSMTDALKEKDAEGDMTTQDNGSNSSVQVKSSIDFWQELETSLKIMLGDAQFSVHRQGGIISVMGTTRQHKMVEEYLGQLEHVIGAQVLIEAKVIEVALNQEFQSGINWSLMGDGKTPIFSSSFFKNEDTGPSLLATNLRTSSSATDAFSLMLRSLERFGSLRVVSSPRITVLNNQTAIIKVAENEVFFKVNYQTSFLGWAAKNRGAGEIPREDNYQTISSSEIRTKPVGFIMPIQVSINRDTREVILFVRPTVSRKKGSTPDPAVRFNSKAKGIAEKDMLDSQIPIIEVREIDSVIRLKSGNVAILGGLMETRAQDARKGPAGSERMPILGHALGAQKGEDSLIELVILLKATIVGDRPIYDSSDLRLMRYYTNDPRPF